MRLARVMLAVLLIPLAALAADLPGDIAGPLDRLERLHGRGLVLSMLRGRPELVDELVKARKCTKAQLAEQTPAFEQAGAEVAQNLVDAVGAAVEGGNSAVVGEVVSRMRGRPFPHMLAYVPVAKLLAKRLKFAAQTAEDRAPLEQAIGDLDAFVAETSKSRRDPQSWASSLVKGMGAVQFWDAFAAGFLGAFGDVPTPAAGKRLDVNTASAAELAALPGIGSALAARIVEERTRRGGFDGLDDLASIAGVGDATLASLRTAATASPVVHAVKDWTVLVFTACANNREFKGMHELNLMEKVGSTDKVNVVVQLARIDGAEIQHADMPDDRSSANWSGVRRYYVTRGTDEKNIESRRIASLGRVDMGSEKTLAEFFTWGIKHFPAKRYCLVVRNHGGGSAWGIASDDHFDSHITTAGLGRALDAARTAIGDDRKIDIVALQACLMGMVEIASELKSSTKYLIASEALSPGMWDWDKILADLTAHPGAQARRVTEEMIKRRVEDVEVMNKTWKRVEFTVAAYDLEKLEPLESAVDRLGKVLKKHWKKESAAFAEAVGGAWRLDRTAVDLGDMCRRLAERAKHADVVAAAREAIDALGYPMRDPKEDELTITSSSPGSVVWGVDGWKAPPAAIQPAGTRRYFMGNAVETPLVGPDAKGQYVMELPPFLAGEVKIDTIQYRLVGPRGGVGADREIKDVGRISDGRLVKTFGARSPLVAEAHNAGHARATGFAIVLPDPKDPKRNQGIQAPLAELKFAKNGWGKLVDALLDGSLAPPGADAAK